MANFYPNLCVALTGLNANDNPGPGVAVARALRSAFGGDIKIIGLCYEALEPGIYMRGLINKTYQVPYPTAGADALLHRIQYIHAKEGLNLIIPNFDAELYNFIKLAAQLAQLGIHSVLPTHKQLALRDKINLNNFGHAYGFNVPADKKLFSANEIAEAGDELGYPLMIKGKYYEAAVVYNQEQAQKVFFELSAKWGLPVIAQQFIAGTEINIAGLGNGKGINLSVIPMRKLYITDKGKAWAGVTIADDLLIGLAVKFAAVTNWQGGYELEIMRTADDKLFILEINPRFPAWIYLTVAAGQNQPEALVKVALGEMPEPFTNYHAGKMFVRYSWDEVVDIADFQQISAYGEF